MFQTTKAYGMLLWFSIEHVNVVSQRKGHQRDQNKPFSRWMVHGLIHPMRDEKNLQSQPENHFWNVTLW